MNVFISYSGRDGRLVAEITATLRSLGHDLHIFGFEEGLDDSCDFISACSSGIVFYSDRSRLTDAVRVSKRLLESPCKSLVLIDEAWDPYPQAGSVFESFESERIVFSQDVIVLRLLRLFSGTPDIEALAAPEDQQREHFPMSDTVSTLGLLRGAEPSRGERASLARELATLAPRPAIRGSLLEMVGVVRPALKKLSRD